MNKKFRSVLLFAALSMATTGTFVSCEDYDDDISSLQEQITRNANSIAALQSAYSGGNVIKSVVKNGKELVVTLSDGSSYTLKDGEDANVWTIDADGWWCLNGVRQAYKAVGVDGKDGVNGKDGADGKDGVNGKDGVDGKDGADGKDGKDGADGKDADVWTPGPDGYWYKNGVKTENSWKASTLTAVVDGKKVRFTNIDGLEGDIVISMVLELKSLVFEPDFYWKGIEAFEVSTFQYDPFRNVMKVSADDILNLQDEKVYKADKGDSKGLNDAVFFMAPDMACTYHLNPANAEVKSDVAAWKFIAYNKETRSTGDNVSSNFKISSADLKTKGKVTIHSQYNGNVIKDIAKDNKVTVLALQYIAGDSVITSDYAAVQASKYKDLVLNNPKKSTTPCNAKLHLYKTAKEAAEAKYNDVATKDRIVEVKWDNDKGIDLREYVNTHYTRVEADGTEKKDIQWDKNAASGKVEESGFKYTFELVGYRSGENKTSQSAHAAIAADGYTLRAQMTKEGKQQAYAYDATKANNEQNKALIGREPVVRVLLTDTINNKVAAVGYFKIRIVEENVDPDVNAINVELSTTTDYTIACENKELDPEVMRVTWHQVEEQIIAKVDMSKETFEAKYDLDGFTSTNKEAYQFDKIDGKELKGAEKIGKITRTEVDIEGKQTQVLIWNFENQEAYKLFKGTKEGETKTIVVYARYALKPDQTAVNQYIWVKFTWTPGKVSVMPKTAFSNDNKNKSYWYAENGNVAGEGTEWTDIHGNVEVVGTDVAFETEGNVNKETSKADDEFVFDIRSTLVGNKLITDELVKPYDVLESSAKRTLKFVSGYVGSGSNKKELKASTDGQFLNYGLISIAQMDPETGVVKLLDTEEGKKLLNLYDHKDLANTLTATVAVEEEVCTYGKIPVENNQFNVKFLRPITLNDAKATIAKDGETGGSVVPVELSFSDWRDHDFLSADAKDYNYFKYYGIRNINVKVTEAMTDQTGTKKPLSEVNKFMQVEYYDAEGTKDGNVIKVGVEGKRPAKTDLDFGTLHYQNNGTTVGQFTMWIPVEITYDWGTLNATLVCTVGNTVANARQK